MGDSNFPAKPFAAKCQKCGESFAKPPRQWDCPKCQGKCWQPDEEAACCQQCGGPVAKFSRHHCRQCGRVTCATCTQYSTIIPECCFNAASSLLENVPEKHE